MILTILLICIFLISLIAIVKVFEYMQILQRIFYIANMVILLLFTLLKDFLIECLGLFLLIPLGVFSLFWIFSFIYNFRQLGTSSENPMHRTYTLTRLTAAYIALFSDLVLVSILFGTLLTFSHIISIAMIVITILYFLFPIVTALF